MRRLLLFVALPIALILMAVLALPFLIDVNKFRPQIQASLEKQLHRTVSLGEMSLHVFPLAVRVMDLRVDEMAAFPSPLPFAAAKEIDVSVSLGSLLGKQIDVTSVLLKEPAIELIVSAKGVWNYADILGNSSGGAGRTLALDDLRIENGRVAVTDLQKHQARQVYDHIDVRLRGLAPGQTMRAECSAHLPGKGKQLVSFTGQGDLPAAFSGKLKLEEISLGGLREFLKSGAMDTLDAVASGEADIDAHNGATSLRGNLTLTGGRARGTELGFPLQADYDITQNAEANLIKLNKVELKMGSVPLSIAGQVNTSTPPSVDVTVRTNGASLKEVLALGRAFMTGESEMGGTGTLTMAAHIQGPAAQPKMSGSATIPDATLTLGAGSKPISVKEMSARFENSKGQVDIASLADGDLVLDHVHAGLEFDRGVFKMTPLTANIYGGKATGGITIDTRSKVLTYALNTKLDGTDANKLLTAAAAIKDKIYGTLAANADATMTSGAAGLGTLNGTAGLRLNNGKITGVNLLNEMSSIGKFLGFVKQSEPFTNVAGLSGDFKIANGIATTDNLHLDLEGATVAGTGSVNLPAQTLNLHLTTVLGQGLSQRVGGAGIGGLMSTALSNGKGELVIPAVVTGTFDHPRFEPDLGAVAQMKLHNLLPSAANPGALGKSAADVIGGILGAFQKSKPQPRK